LKKSTAKAPSHLSPEARRWWRRLQQEYAFDDQGGLLLLQTALESFDRMRAAQAAIKEDGATSLDRFGQLKAHPLLPTERDARAAMMAALRQLNLDLEPLRDGPGRPPG
jgi:P27 family predicted phage terminase small subunit